MGEDFHSRLRRLGVVKGVRELKPVEPRPPAPLAEQPAEPLSEAEESPWAEDDPPPLAQLLPGGYLSSSPYGDCFVLDHVFPLSFDHGQDKLADLLGQPLPALAAIGQDRRLAARPATDFLFLDTETTGLFGAGTLAFMVGVAFFEAEALVVRQYFLRDHGDEPAMLHQLAELLAHRGTLVTFNGRSFDLPLLDSRYVLNRLDDQAADLLTRPHLDLLPPARRLWRSRIGSCALGSLEQHLLGLRRSLDDVPGWLIPGLYLDYLRSGDARPLLRVFYHNRMDMLSMVTLASRVTRLFARPRPDDHPLDLLSLGRWQLALGLTAEAEANLRLAAAGELPMADYHQVLYQLGSMLKRAGRRDEAVRIWQQIAVTAYDDVAAHVELAKHYEWQDVDLDAACYWTEGALNLLDRRPGESAERDLVRLELEHRLARLQRKRMGSAEE